MNEKLIDELMKQASVDLFGDGLARVDYRKFAELIVTECANVCYQQSQLSWNDDRRAQAKLDRNSIKEHFGVDK